MEISIKTLSKAGKMTVKKYFCLLAEAKPISNLLLPNFSPYPANSYKFLPNMELMELISKWSLLTILLKMLLTLSISIEPL